MRTIFATRKWEKIRISFLVLLTIFWIWYVFSTQRNLTFGVGNKRPKYWWKWTDKHYVLKFNLSILWNTVFRVWEVSLASTLDDVKKLILQFLNQQDYFSQKKKQKKPREMSDLNDQYKAQNVILLCEIFENRLQAMFKKDT